MTILLQLVQNQLWELFLSSNMFITVDLQSLQAGRCSCTSGGVSLVVSFNHFLWALSIFFSSIPEYQMTNSMGRFIG